MDEFGFFSEASTASAKASSSYSESARSQTSSHHAPYQRSGYPEFEEQHQSRAHPSSQPLDVHQHRYLQPQQQQEQQYPHRLTKVESDSASVPLRRSNSINTGVHGSPTTAKRGSNLACLKCRAIKVKCWKSNPNDPRCARCNRLDLFCEFREHHRGKKLEKVIADENRHVILTPEMLRRARLHILRCSSYPLNLDLASMAASGNADDAAHLAAPPSSSYQAFPTMLADPTYTGLAGMAASESPSPMGMASSVYDDVVQLNACSWTDACYLFSLFVTQLNPIVSLLEPSLHTVHYTREQSPVLFSTILSVSSRFFRPELHPQCQASAAAILKFAASRQLCSIDHVQALIVSAIWATPSDAARSETLVAAVAYAYELGLPFCFESGMAVASATKPYTPPLPVHLLHASHQSTTLRVQQRTWIQLCLLELSRQSDSRRSSMLNRPELIAQNDLPNVRAWYELHHSTMSANDTRLAYQLDFAICQREFNRIAASASGSDQALISSIDSLLVRERECFATWFNTYGEDYVPRYAMDRYSSAEAGFLLLLYRFGRAVQLHSIVRDSARQPEERWSATATEMAFKVIDYFINKILDQDSALSSMLRLSPQYMAVGCVSVARWLLNSTFSHRARDRVREMVRLLGLPQFYPDGNRVATSTELTGQLDQALRSLLGDTGMPISPGLSISPKRARAQDFQQQVWEGQRKQPRRSQKSPDSGSVASRTANSNSDRASDRSLPPTDRFRPAAAGAEGNLSIDIGLAETHWPALMAMGGAQHSWTPTSESGFSNVAMAPSSISPPASDSSAVFSVAAAAATHPDSLNLGSYPFGTTHAVTTAPADPSLVNARHYYTSGVNPSYSSLAGSGAMFDGASGGGQFAPIEAFPLERSSTVTPQSYDPTAGRTRIGAQHQQPQYASTELGTQSGLDASLTIGLGASYDGSSAGSDLMTNHAPQ
ncbi:Zn(2)-C6 fungal-type domain-containing protein [Pseudozyma hubeiensis]|nr:Zn(2)-C6 fungal-type domain-containing protein [Pseudozyma hubeiensis]